MLPNSAFLIFFFVLVFSTSHQDAPPISALDLSCESHIEAERGIQLRPGQVKCPSRLTIASYVCSCKLLMLNFEH